MKEFTYTIKEPVGIHARPAGMLAKEAKTCQSTVTIVDKNGKSVDATRLMALTAWAKKDKDLLKDAVYVGTSVSGAVLVFGVLITWLCALLSIFRDRTILILHWQIPSLRQLKHGE